MKDKNILLIQTAYIGDVILTTPLFQVIKKNFPNSHLTVMVKPEALPLLETNPHVDNILIIDKKGKHKGFMGIVKIIKIIRRLNFDILLAPHQSHRTGIVAMFSRIPVRCGYESSGFKRLAYTKRLKRDLKQPEIIRLLQFLGDSLNLPIEKYSTKLYLYESQDSEREARGILSNLLNTSPPILLSPSSVWPTKRWPPWKFAQLIGRLLEKYNSHILLIGSTADIAIAEEIELFVKEIHPHWFGERLLNVCGKTGLLSLFSLMKRSALLISNDSAPVHVGCAAEIPVVALFGPTIPGLGYAPIAPRTVVAEATNLSCRPCGTHGSKSCPLGHHRCMKNLSVDEVFQKALQVMGK